jgi:hypothetical protein
MPMLSTYLYASNNPIASALVPVEPKTNILQLLSLPYLFFVLQRSGLPHVLSFIIPGFTASVFCAYITFSIIYYCQVPSRPSRSRQRSRMNARPHVDRDDDPFHARIASDSHPSSDGLAFRSTQFPPWPSTACIWSIVSRDWFHIEGEHKCHPTIYREHCQSTVPPRWKVSTIIGGPCACTKDHWSWLRWWAVIDKRRMQSRCQHSSWSW